MSLAGYERVRKSLAIMKLVSVGHFAREHVTWLSLCGLVAVITGFTPEEWVAHLAQQIRISSTISGHWPPYLDVRAVIVAVGVAVIVIDVLLKRRARERVRPAAATATVSVGSQADVSRRSALQEDQARAYKELWEMLEDVHVRLRGKPAKSSQFSQQLRDINAFAMKNGLLIDEVDRASATSYLEAVRDYCNIVRESGDEGAIADLEETSYITGEALERLRQLGLAQEKVQVLRSQLMDRFRSVIEDK